MNDSSRLMPRRALISVSDKTGLLELGQALQKAGVEIISTGQTATTLLDGGVRALEVSEVTGFAEALDGRVKTLHPAIHGGILADRRKKEHVQALQDLGITPIDLVVVNLYPFVETVASGAEGDAVVEQIDIGGPAMVRAAAKNHASVAIVVSPSRYHDVISGLAEGGLTLEFRRLLAQEAFSHTADYDRAVADWFTGGEWVTLRAQKQADLRYGENSHQSAAVFGLTDGRLGLAQARVLQGKEMSYNNYLDADAAVRAAFDHDPPAVAIIKHQNPCGIATANSIGEAHHKAHDCDPVSAFGGVIAANREVDAKTAAQIVEIFTEVVVAPSFSAEALEIFAKKKNVRVVELPPGFSPPLREIRPISGGLLSQDTDRHFAPPESWTLVAGPNPSAETLNSLAFAQRAVRAVKSNAILLAQGTHSVGIGMGQVNRLDSCRLAVSRAGDRAAGSVAASDAFFPFADGLEILVAASVSAVVQPGGSIRDDEVIALAKKSGITLFHTGERHFFH
jgi:phosphoribosylaminoimidazolecarboxamide formyltransferase / IMP cyclohydrolase